MAKAVGDYGAIQLPLPAREPLVFENRIVSDFLPTRIAALYLGLSENALRIRVCRGQVKAHKFGRNLRFKMSELALLLQPNNLKGDLSGNY